MKKYIFILLALIVLLLVYFLFFFDRSPAGPDAPKSLHKETKYLIDGNLFFVDRAEDTLSTLFVEVARDHYAQARGLMYRHHMPDSLGMLFVYDDSDYRSFWMKNTHIGLDLIFVDDMMEIKQIHKYAIPYSEESIISRDKAKYVIEVNAGYTDRNRIQPGVKVILDIK